MGKKETIIQSIKIVLLIVCAYVAYHSYMQYQNIQHKQVAYEFEYNKQAIDFSSIWSDGQFEESVGIRANLEFSVLEGESLIKIGTGSKQQIVSF